MALQTISAAAVHSGNMASGGEGRGFAPGQSPVLRIIVENLFYPVTLEVLQQVGTLLLLSGGDNYYYYVWLCYYYYFV